MRDDLEMLFNELKQHQDKKIELLTDFRNREFELKHLLSGSIDDDIILLIDTQDRLITEIDLCDYMISAAMDKIKLLSGIDPLKPGIERFIKYEDKLVEFQERVKIINKFISEIKDLKAENITRMEILSAETSEFSDELDRIDKVQRRYIRDLQSS